jgi:hypothetical protein
MVRSAMQKPWPQQRRDQGFVVVETGVDPVTSRFSGARSAN